MTSSSTRVACPALRPMANGSSRVAWGSTHAGQVERPLDGEVPGHEVEHRHTGQPGTGARRPASGFVEHHTFGHQEMVRRVHGTVCRRQRVQAPEPTTQPRPIGQEHGGQSDPDPRDQTSPQRGPTPLPPLTMGHRSPVQVSRTTTPFRIRVPTAGPGGLNLRVSIVLGTACASKYHCSNCGTTPSGGRACVGDPPRSDRRQTQSPPSTESTAPVVNGESPEARKAMEAAISAGVA